MEEATQIPVDDLEKNFAIWAEKNGLGVDAYCKIFDEKTQKQIKAVRTYRDTGFVSLPAGNYYISVRPLEGSDVEGITLAGINISGDKLVTRSVSFDAGVIRVNTLNNNEGWDAVVNIYSEPGGKNVSNGRTYGKAKEFELIPGTYKVILKALGMKGHGVQHVMENVKIEAKQTTEIEHNLRVVL